MSKVAILGAGQIGQAVFQIIKNLNYSLSYHANQIDVIIFDSNKSNLLFANNNSFHENNFEIMDVDIIAEEFREEGVTHIINALPFYMNEKVATAAVKAGCSYIDFTEDDIMADKVQEIFRDSGLTCVVKCGLAPGFINYLGNSLTNKIDLPDILEVAVGALPRSISYDSNHPENAYNLTWSVDGLVNEYIKPCRIRENGQICNVPPLSNLTKVIIDGTEYEAALTSGGIGSLVQDLTNVSNVSYKTLRYPGHYKYISELVKETNADFGKLRSIFLEKFSFTDDDVIIVYGKALGKDKNGRNICRSYANKFYGVDGLTAIQSTTASSGVAILELILNNVISGIVNHTEIPFESFTNTISFKKYYKIH